MIVKCASCRKTYDDARCWTICPHNSLDVGVAAPYCRQHDLYYCYLCGNDKHAYQEQLGEYQDKREWELHELRSWKQDMLDVEKLWDPQEVAELLHIPAGHGIRASLEPAIRRLLQRCNQAETRCETQRTTIEGYKAVWRELFDKMHKMVHKLEPQ